VCGPNGLGRGGRVLSDGPARLGVGVSVDRNCRACQVARTTMRPGRWCARSGPLSGAGSCRPSPDRQCDATSADPPHRTAAAAGSEVCKLWRAPASWSTRRLTQRAPTTMPAIARPPRANTPTLHRRITHAPHAASHPRQSTVIRARRLTPALYRSLPLTITKVAANPAGHTFCLVWGHRPVTDR
jgi:hypothetical protein